jgi:hypothetical protein
MVKKIASRFEFPDGSKVFEKAIMKAPEKYFTEEFLQKLDAHMQSVFSYTMPTATPSAESDTEADDE